MNFLQDANSAFQKGDYTTALRLYKQVLAEHSRYGDDLADLARFNLNLAQLRIKSFASALSINNHINGFIDSVTANRISGWFVDKAEPARTVNCSVYLDGIFYQLIHNDQPRPDLSKAGLSAGAGGFSVEIHSWLIGPSSVVSLRFENGVCFDDIALGATFSWGSNRSASAAWPAAQPLGLAKHPPVSVVVPIFNALSDVKRCIQCLLAYTYPSVEVLLINDASTNPAIVDYLDSAALPPHFRVVHNRKNLGYTRTVNHGIELAENNDVVLLNSDARVTPRWLQGVQRALASDPLIATVTPMSDRAGAFSAPDIGNHNPLPSKASEADYAVAFRRHGLGLYPTVPTGNGFCLYIRRQALNQIGAFDAAAFPRGYGEENDFCMRARAAGWRNVIDDRTYVFHERNQSFGEAKQALIKAGRAVIDQRYPDYSHAISVFSQSPNLAAARFQARKAWQSVAQGEPSKPRVLFVIATLTGGTPQTNRDLMSALDDAVEPWLLHCDSQTLRLYQVVNKGPDVLIHQHDLTEPVEPLTHVSHEYDRVVRHWLASYDFTALHIRHLAWHSLHLPRLAKAEGLRVIKSFHDFYAACPTVKLLDENQRYCAGNCTRTHGACQPELWQATSSQPVFPALKHQWVHQWRQLFVEKVVPYCDAFVMTHSSVKDVLQPLLGLPDAQIHIIPHGRHFHQFLRMAAPCQPDTPLRILVLGNISQAKGSQIIGQLAQLDKGEKLHFHILGVTELAEQPGITLHGAYQRDELAARVAKINPHVGGIFSIWNETWCHTLTELWALGIPAIVTDFPTLKDRVSRSGAGWVMDIEALAQDPEKLYELINQQQSEKLEHIAETQHQMQTYGTADHMAAAYHAVYFEKFLECSSQV